MNYKTIINKPWESISGIPIGGGVELNEAYLTPLIYRATKIRCNSLTRIPRYFFNESDEEVDYAFEAALPFRELLWWTEAALLLKGAAYLLKLKNRYRYGKGLQWLNPFTIQTEYRDGELRFWQQLPTGERFPKGEKFWTADDFVYMREFNPNDDLGCGVAAADVALNDATSSASVSQFLANFFRSDAIPITMLMMSDADDTERTRVENWFKKKLRQMAGTANRVLGIKGDLKVERLTSALKDYDFSSIDDHATNQIAHAFEIPKSILTAESANFATAQVERRIYIEDTIIPRCTVFEDALNPFLETVGQRLEFSPQELPEMQEDEAMRSDSLNKLISAGIPLLAAIDILGYDLSKDAERLIKKAVKEKANTPPPQMQPPQSPDQMPPDQPLKADLDKWLRKALKSMKSGKRAKVEFESEYIPNEMKSEILIALESATTEEEVRKSFNRSNHE